MADLHPNVERVLAAARERGLDLTVQQFPDGTRAAAAAGTRRDNFPIAPAELVRASGGLVADLRQD